MLNFIEELRWRGMLHDMTPGADELMQNKKVVGYIGFDPTAPSMTIGNFVQIMLLKLFQLSGHQPIVLMGGATGRIGDPSFKDKERDLKSYDELDSNLSFQKEQIKKFLDFEGPNAAIIVNNLDFYKNMNILDFLRDVGKTLTVSYMMSKDSVKNRLETGLSFTEFSYQLLQSYDFQLLFDQYNCVLQMGGSDQWGNITSGTEFIRRNIDGKAYAVTTPLLTKADGSKFGKSEQGNIWLDPKLTSPYKFYQFWLNADDADLPKYLRYFTLKSKEEVENLEQTYTNDPRGLKAILAEELTRRVHSDDDFKAVSQVSQLLFGNQAGPDTLLEMGINELHTIAEEIPCKAISASDISQGINIVDLLTVTTILPSKTEARKAIQGNAISINKVKVTQVEQMVTSADLLHNMYFMVENGKKNKFLIKIQD
ncbi:MAG TPA: tyrosine--tRNA ligase [Saprospiraceae bacterium]|jgi:tyrosyl-tRNA synthetase|nr:tyrosine--tRNA ligase [Saprospiraceae bacterium]HQV97569.1 tyrosine--tRNA ligase [Saprospiraceae bacterium]